MQRTFERTVPHAPVQMLELVADVKSYPDFIPNCESMTVTGGHPPVDDRYDARMLIRFGPIAQAYTSRIVVDRDALTLSATSRDAPFRYLDSLWRFEPRGEGTHIVFSIDFRIANPLIAAVAEPAFAAKQDEIMDAFVREADRRFPR